MRTMHQITCQQCGKIFNAIDKRRKFCSIECTGKSLKGRIKRSETYTCKNCGKEYRPKTADRINYCSRQCAFEDWKKQSAIEKAKKEQERIESWPKCKTCGKPVKEYRHRFCSDECRKQSNNTKSYNRSKGRKTLNVRVCIGCGKEFIPEYGNKHRAYCSNKCLLIYGRREAKHIRRARKKTQTIEIFARKEIYERDNWTCGICGKKVKRKASVPHPQAPVLDHIVPLAKGGTHERKNVQCAHFLCNSIKSDKASEYGDQLRLIG